MTKIIGQRVGAIRSSSTEQVEFYGFGTYIGDLPLPARFAPLDGVPSPCIELDNGHTVYGIECWWASEEKIAEVVAGKRIVSAMASDSFGETAGSAA
jgi:hypothetical protein